MNKDEMISSVLYYMNYTGTKTQEIKEFLINCENIKTDESTENNFLPLSLRILTGLKSLDSPNVNFIISNDISEFETLIVECDVSGIGVCSYFEQNILAAECVIKELDVILSDYLKHKESITFTTDVLCFASIAFVEINKPTKLKIKLRFKID